MAKLLVLAFVNEPNPASLPCPVSFSLLNENLGISGKW